MRRLLITSFLLILFLLIPYAAYAYTAELTLANGQVTINSIENDDGTWFFLPTFADLSSFSIAEISEDCILNPVEDEEGVWSIETSDDEIYVMKSQHLRTMFLFSDDPENKGREYIESDSTHTLEITGSMILISQDGHTDFAGRLRQIRGRGNSTWLFDKKPYQIKLENKYDLLESGNPSEKNRTWVLLADAIDTSLLHNQIALDLAKEMGLYEAGNCEHVDLYFDGDYRGTYLLTEKVEIGEGRTEGMDYDKLIEQWNRWVENDDPSLFQRAKGENSNGDPICYIENIQDNGVVSAGAYLIEMYGRKVADVLSGFTLDDDRAFELSSPKYASREMVCHVSELLSDGLAALQNGGIHPVTGESLDKWFDLESFSRVLLLDELVRNWDAFIFTSTYFLLPENSEQFVAGPVWDFDRTMRQPEFRNDAGYAWGIKDSNWPSWASEFYTVPAFINISQKIYEQEIYPLINNILLGKNRGRYLLPLDEYIEQIRPSALMNNRLWPVQEKDHSLHYADSFDTDVIYLRQFFEQRNEWMYQTFVQNGESDADHVLITMSAEWVYPEEALDFYIFPWSKAEVQSYSHHQLTEATETDYALWQVKLVLSAQEGYSFHDPQIRINDSLCSGQIQPDGTLVVEFLFEDLSYRPVDYYGDDIGLIFNPDFYAYNYPEVAIACENDPDQLADHFCSEGMYEAYIGNGFFDPKEILRFHPRLQDIMGEDWALYYWDYLSYGYDIEGWMESVNAKYVPPIHPIE